MNSNYLREKIEKSNISNDEKSDLYIKLNLPTNNYEYCKLTNYILDYITKDTIYVKANITTYETEIVNGHKLYNKTNNLVREDFFNDLIKFYNDNSMSCDEFKEFYDNYQIPHYYYDKEKTYEELCKLPYSKNIIKECIIRWGIFNYHPVRLINFICEWLKRKSELLKKINKRLTKI